jgi:protoheme IX farnesyltransferase
MKDGNETQIHENETSEALVTESGRAGSKAARSKKPPKDGLLPNFPELSKARLNALVLGTTAVGFVVAPVQQTAMILFWTMIGTGLVAASSAMMNQLAEIELDRRMERTERRPLPAGLVSKRSVFITSMLLAYAGVVILGLKVNLLCSGLALANLLIYIVMYTPMKTRTTLNTLVGAICGAIPPMIGWAAATGDISGGAWLLGLILFIWQLPHFFALAVMYKADYERGGFAMLPVKDHRGEVTVQVILTTSLMLLPLGLSITAIGVAGMWYAAVSVLMGIWMTWNALKLYLNRNRDQARKVFFSSLAYLPIVLGVMVLDRGPSVPSPELYEAMNPLPDTALNAEDSTKNE